MEAEVKVLRTVRDELVKRAGLDQRRVYVAGFSKGGWVSGLLLQKERWLAGAAILGAGHMYPLEAVPKPFGHEVPIFVGVGSSVRHANC
jgi:poly(3-hydroxybutyrate) depolymerase